MAETTNSTRRTFLQRLGVGAAATTLPAAALAANLPAPIAEDPFLVAHWEAFQAAIADLQVATQGRDEALATYTALAPSLPDELVLDPNDHRFTTHRETDVTGEEIWWSAAHPPRRILTADTLRFDARDYSARTKIGKAVRQKLKVAEDHEARVATAKDASGIVAAIDRLERAQSKVDLMVSGAVNAAGKVVQAGFRDFEARTMEGVRIKAQAAWLHRQNHRDSSRYNALIHVGNSLIDDIVRLSGGLA